MVFVSKKFRLFALVTLTGFVSAVAGGQDIATIADVRCMLVGLQLAGSKDATQKSQGVLLAWYYIGRLDGRMPKLDIHNLVDQERGLMTGADYISEAKRCGTEFAERGKQISEIGRSLGDH